MWPRLTQPIVFWARKLTVAYCKMGRREKAILFFLVSVLFLAIFLKIRGYYLARLDLAPAPGGIYKEGVVGRPQLINPLLATNGAEKSLVKLVYQGLFQYNQQGKLVPQLAEKLTGNKSRDQFRLKLKDDLRWADGQEITTKDIEATLRLVKAKDYQGPWQGQGWEKVESKVLSQQIIEFQLNRPNPFFKELLTLPILPDHLIGAIEPDRLALNEINQKPASSGPYQIDNIIYQEDSAQVFLSPNPNFDGERPYISRLVIYCYPDYQAMLSGLKKGQVSGLSFIKPADWIELDQGRVQLREIELPQITAAFFNLRNRYLKSKKIRKALVWAIDREKIGQNFFKNKGVMIDGPLPIPVQKTAYRPQSSEKILKSLGKKITLRLVTSQDATQRQIAEDLKKEWGRVNVKIKIEIFSEEEIDSIIQDGKEYDILLFGQNLGPDLNLFSYWHSSQISKGFNLSQLKNSSIDQFLEECRVISGEKKRRGKIGKADCLIRNQYPALFLFSPYYLHLIPADIKGAKEKTQGVVPEDRLFKIEDWYLREKRAKQG